MAAGVHDRISGRGIAGGSRRFHQNIRGHRVVGGDSGVGEVGGGDRRKLGVHGGRIDGHGSQIGRERGWNLVRGRRIGRGGFRINSQGDLYAPDSEDEDAMEVAAEVAPGMKVAAEAPPAVELPREVQARLEMVLATIDPVYHDVFINLYKVIVPAFFKCN